MKAAPEHILICRTDSIGDVVLTLPLCGFLRERIPGVRISFLGRSYTSAVIRACRHVDTFLNWDDWGTGTNFDALPDAAVFAFPDPAVMAAISRAGVPVRIATAGRWAAWKHANQRVWFSRKGSDLHESQLNFRLLDPLGFSVTPALTQIAGWYGLQPSAPLPEHVSRELEKSDGVRIILHPLSKGSAVNWSPERFRELAELLPASRFRLFVTGTAAEQEAIRSMFDFSLPHLTDVSGQLDLTQLISFIGACDGLVAASTGPLHIASALGKKAIGLFSPQRPIHPGRWAPVGTRAEVFVADAPPAPGRPLDIPAAAVARALMVFSEETGGRR